MHEDILNRNNVLREQAKDIFCNKQEPGTYSSRTEFFFYDTGDMYRRQPHDKHQLVVPELLFMLKVMYFWLLDRWILHF
jgi:hypothetical protein